MKSGAAAGRSALLVTPRDVFMTLFCVAPTPLVELELELAFDPLKIGALHQSPFDADGRPERIEEWSRDPSTNAPL